MFRENTTQRLKTEKKKGKETSLYTTQIKSISREENTTLSLTLCGEKGRQGARAHIFQSKSDD